MRRSEREREREGLDKNAREVSNLVLRPINHYGYKIRAKVPEETKVFWIESYCFSVCRLVFPFVYLF